MRNRMIGVVVLGLVISAAVYAQQRGGKTLSAQDALEIQQIYSRFSWALDNHADNGMAYARLYTTDGVFEWVEGKARHVGHEMLAKLVMDGHGMDPIKPHFHVTNIWFEPSPEGARGGAYVANTSGEGANLIVRWTGTYEDTFVKTPQGWKIKQRKLRIGALPEPAQYPSEQRLSFN